MTDAIRKYALSKVLKKEFDCAKEYTLSMFSGKYKIVIIYHLATDGTLRFSQLQRILERSSHKMLTQQLRELEEDGIIQRQESFQQNRKAVFYSMTSLGQTLLPIIDLMFSWGENRLSDLQISY